ncbi:hypothetical protein DFH27DRAFT_303185 [Peziza echinospora]|nr:hypothetical protein DFH27DRAFT_303185 [Peziza echinospora]
MSQIRNSVCNLPNSHIFYNSRLNSAPVMAQIGTSGQLNVSKYNMLEKLRTRKENTTHLTSSSSPYQLQNNCTSIDNITNTSGVAQEVTVDADGKDAYSQNTLCSKFYTGDFCECDVCSFVVNMSPTEPFQSSNNTITNSLKLLHGSYSQPCNFIQGSQGTHLMSAQNSNSSYIEFSIPQKPAFNFQGGISQILIKEEDEAHSYHTRRSATEHEVPRYVNNPNEATPRSGCSSIIGAQGPKATNAAPSPAAAPARRFRRHSASLGARTAPYPSGESRKYPGMLQRRLAPGFQSDSPSHLQELVPEFIVRRQRTPSMASLVSASDYDDGYRRHSTNWAAADAFSTEDDLASSTSRRPSIAPASADPASFWTESSSWALTSNSPSTPIPSNSPLAFSYITESERAIAQQTPKPKINKSPATAVQRINQRQKHCDGARHSHSGTLNILPHNSFTKNSPSACASNKVVWNCQWRDCQGSFTTRYNLQRHEKTVHRACDPTQSPPKYDCPEEECERKGYNGFSRRDNMIQHQKMVHMLPLQGSRVD